MAGRIGSLFSVADRVYALGVQPDQGHHLLYRSRPPLAQCQIVFPRASFIGVPFQTQLSGRVFL